MTIDPKAFSTRMEQHWTENLGNIANEPLRQTWEQIAKTFNDHIRYHNDPELATKWSVLQPPTGSGKTQSVILYSSLLADLPVNEQPGILIVTRLIKDCDRIAKQINDLAGTETAIAYHSESKVKPDNLREYPVLVITHRAYENALDYLGESASIRQTWPYFHNWGRHTRKLVVIDESIDIVESSQAGLDGLRQTLAAIPEKVREKYPKEVNIVDGIIQILQDASTLSKESNTPVKEAMMVHSEKYLSRHKSSVQVSEGVTDLGALISAIQKKEIRFDHQIGRNDLLESERLRRRHTKRLKDLQYILRSWRYYSGVEKGGALHTARLLIPEDIKGAVVLDATASRNVIYELHKDSCIIPTPDGTRNYQNVTLHISRGHKVGKTFMRNNVKKLAGEFISELNQVIGRDKKALIITHKDVEPVLNKYDTSFDMQTGHWGKVDGSNQWRDCDTVVIFGLPYLPDHWTADVYMALQGSTSTEWLQNSDQRAFGTHTDIRQALKHGQITSNVIQGINRVRCRKVIDSAGNCEETHIYLLLPSDSLAGELLDSIQALMPGIKVNEWDYTGSKKKPKASKHEASLIKYIQNMQSGSREALGHIGKTIGISPRTMQRLAGKAKDSDTELGKAMDEHSVRLELKKAGRTKKQYFIKSEPEEIAQTGVDTDIGRVESQRVQPTVKPVSNRRLIAGYEEI